MNITGIPIEQARAQQAEAAEADRLAAKAARDAVYGPIHDRTQDEAYTQLQSWLADVRPAIVDLGLDEAQAYQAVADAAQALDRLADVVARRLASER